jgi:hypothetical protein
MGSLKIFFGLPLSLTMVLSTALAELAHCKDERPYKRCESPAEAIRKNYFLCYAKVSPENFEMMGHQIKVKYAWVEKGLMGEANICFEFWDDGRPEDFDYRTRHFELRDYPYYADDDFMTVSGCDMQKHHRIRRPAIDGQKVGALCQVYAKDPKTSTKQILGPILELESEIPLSTWPSNDLGEPEV